MRGKEVTTTNSHRATRTVLRATITPLASIFGGGFLVVVPVLASAVGPYSVFAMASVLLLAFGVGGVVRHNITVVEPVLARDPPRIALVFERASTLALIGAYVLSICLDAHIFAAFALKPFGDESELNKSILVTVILVLIAVMGVVGGLEPLETLEKYALAITLIVIVFLLAGFVHFDIVAAASEGLVFADAPQRDLWDTMRVVAGALIVVQGFEAPRYMADSYDGATRVRASQWSQWIAGGVYLAFVALATPLLAALDGRYDADSLFDLGILASALLPIPLIIAATTSQFSAAIADVIAAAGAADEVSSNRFGSRWAYVAVVGGAIVLAWSGDALTVVAWASRAFAFYYLMQCFVALTVCPYARRKIWILMVACALVFVTIFATPAG